MYILNGSKRINIILLLICYSSWLIDVWISYIVIFLKYYAPNIHDTTKHNINYYILKYFLTCNVLIHSYINTFKLLHAYHWIIYWYPHNYRMPPVRIRNQQSRHKTQNPSCSTRTWRGPSFKVLKQTQIIYNLIY